MHRKRTAVEAMRYPSIDGVPPDAAADLTRLRARRLARATERTTKGVHHGLQQVERLPAAERSDRTLPGFGKQD